MYESHKGEVIPAIIVLGSIATVVVALRRGVYPGFWISRSAQPVRFWLGIAATRAGGLACLAWIVSGFMG